MTTEPRRVLVLGASGQIGIVSGLLAQGHNVLALRCGSPVGTNGARWLSADLTENPLRLNRNGVNDTIHATDLWLHGVT
jgi:hypothetical protein